MIEYQEKAVLNQIKARKLRQIRYDPLSVLETGSTLHKSFLIY